MIGSSQSLWLEVEAVYSHELYVADVRTAYTPTVEASNCACDINILLRIC